MTATPGSGQVSVSWIAPAGANYFVVQRSTLVSNGGGSFNTLSTITLTNTATGTSYIDPTTTNGSTYGYTITAVNASGTGSASTAASAIPLAAIPTTAPVLSAAPGAGQISLNWTAVAGAIGYVIEVSTASNGTFTYVASVSELTYTDTGPADDTTYYYTVAAMNSGGTGPASNIASATTAPAPPASLTAIPGNTQITLTWQAAADATSYIIRRSGVTGGPYTQVGTSTGPSFTNSGLTNGTPYYYVVASSNANGTGSNSLEATATPSASLAVAPTNLFATATNQQIALAWNTSAGASSYVVLRSTLNGGPYTAIATAVTSATYTDTTAESGPTYYYVVAATDASGTGAYSNQASASISVPVLTWTGAVSSGWDFSTANWVNGGGGATTYSDGANVIFPNAATTGTVSIPSSVSPGSITFSNSSLPYVVTSVGAGISGTTGLAQTGAGTLTLSTSNSYSGNTTIASGASLILGNDYALQNSTLDLSNGAISFNGAAIAPVVGGLQGTNAAQNLALSSTAGAVALTAGGNNSTTTYSGNLSGPGSLTKSGSGTLTLGNATYTGSTVVDDNSTLTIAGGAMGSAGSTISVGPPVAPATNPGAPNMNITGGAVISGTVAVGAASNETGASLTISGGTSNFTATILGGNPANGNASNTGGAITITGGVANLGSAYIGRDQAGTAKGLVIDGADAVVTANLLNVSSNAGVNHESDLNVEAGSLTIGLPASTGAFELGTTAPDGNNVLEMTGGTLTYTGSDGLQLGSESFMTITGGTASLSGITVNSAPGGNGTSELTVTGGTLYLGAAGLAMNSPGATVFAHLGTATIGASAAWASSAPVSLTGNTTFQTADASGSPHNITLSGALTGGGALTKTGGGTLILSGPATYSGATSILSGILELTGSLSNTTSLLVANGAVFYLAGGSLTVAGPITNDGIFKLSGSPALAQSGAFINNGVLDLINGPQTLPGNFTNNGAVLDAGSVQVQQLAMSGSNFTLTIQGYAQHTYQLQRTPSLAPPADMVQRGPAQAGAGSVLIFTDTGGATGAVGFYQVQVLAVGIILPVSTFRSCCGSFPALSSKPRETSRLKQAVYVPCLLLDPRHQPSCASSGRSWPSPRSPLRTMISQTPSS